MVVCKFFLQGNCRFGENCKFEHQISDARQTSTSILRQQTPATNTPNIDINVLVSSVKSDILNAEKGGQWLLSSYAPFKDKPCFPGFEDKSFEEVRLGYYEAQNNGTVEQYKQQLQMALQEAIMRNKMLQNPSPDIVNILKNIYNAPVTSTNASSSVFSNQFLGNAPTINAFTQNTGFPSNTNAFSNQQNPSSTFSFSQASKSIFGQATTAATPSVFGGGNQGIFANQQEQTFAQQNNVFTPQPKQDANVFGGGSQSIFGAQQQQTGIFAAAASQQFGASPMFGTQQHNAGSIFGPTQQTNSPFGNVLSNQQEMGFGAQQPVVSPFSSQQPISQFAPQQQTSPFASQPTSVFANENSSVFSQNSTPPTTGNAFAGGGIFNTQSGMGSTAHTNSIFGNQHAAGFGQPSMSGQIVDETAYSKLEDLIENEVKVFESEGFDFGQIPEKPPTLQMCF